MENRIYCFQEEEDGYRSFSSHPKRLGAKQKENPEESNFPKA
jgi:hypothetical protein